MKLEIPDEFFTKEELKKTPKRFQGLLDEWERNKSFHFTTFPNEQRYDQIIVLKDIDFFSMCSHHCLPFMGKAHVGYIPDKLICGISKLARVVDACASKPQIQERMTDEIASYIYKNLNPLGVGVVVEAEHLCMRMRGVKKENSIMQTSALRGKFMQPTVKEEFMKLIGKI